MAILAGPARCFPLSVSRLIVPLSHALWIMSHAPRELGHMTHVLCTAHCRCQRGAAAAIPRPGGARTAKRRGAGGRSAGALQGAPSTQLHDAQYSCLQAPEARELRVVGIRAVHIAYPQVWRECWKEWGWGGMCDVNVWVGKGIRAKGWRHTCCAHRPSAGMEKAWGKCGMCKGVMVGWRVGRGRRA